MTAGDFDGLVVSCKRCGDYEIEGNALNGLLRLGFDERVRALVNASSRASAGHRPSITLDVFNQA
jgi:hypothetical protein